MSFAHISDWIFDLDNTLYPSSSDLFVQMDHLITQYVMGVTGEDFTRARQRQKTYYKEHGTTLRGLMHYHDIDPQDYLRAVHDMDYSALVPNPELGQLIAALPGRKHIYTNGDKAHAERTLNALAITCEFDGMFDIVSADFRPKPASEPYDKFVSEHAIDADRAAMFEDMPRNLEPAKALGFKTVLITPENEESYRGQAWEHDGSTADYVDHTCSDINRFLKVILDKHF